VKSVPVWIWYTALRIVLFAVPLAVLLLAGVNVWVSAIVAAVFGLSASLLFLRRPREAMSTELYAARHRDRPVVRDDDAAEDAAVEASDQPAADAASVAEPTAEPARTRTEPAAE
jgi:outer membrane murein-binding lipoprotein Lpp